MNNRLLGDVLTEITATAIIAFTDDAGIAMLAGFVVLFAVAALLDNKYRGRSRPLDDSSESKDGDETHVSLSLKFTKRRHKK